MKKLPLGQQSFKNIREGAFLYVDKTKQIHTLLETGSQYFLSRPRRFGKSLTISTLTHLFSGRKELFKGLYIHDQTDYKWGAYPILSFNFASLGYRVTDLSECLTNVINRYANAFEVSLEEKRVGNRFAELIGKLAQKGKPVVVLVDEYDKPIIDFLTNIPQAKINLGILRDFFSVLKGVEAKEQLHFLFITGVSKFSKVSIFSDLNHLKDLTISALSHDLVGITEAELHHYFTPHIQETAQQMGISVAFLLENIKRWYDGYTYDGQTHLYNPVSLFNFFQEKVFRNFWFATGTPTFLIEQIRNRGIVPEHLEEQYVEDTFFDKLVLGEALDMSNLMFQTGYLTIKKITTNRRTLKRILVLGYPNNEVYEAFIHNLLEGFTHKVPSVVNVAMVKIKRALAKGDVRVFVEQIQVLLADVSYAMHPSQNRKGKQSAQKNFDMWEGYFHTIIYLITSFIGMSVDTEVLKHKGRLDLVAQTADFIYLMEFKLASSAEQAVTQIKEREYALSYKNSPKTVYLVGINFDKEERNIKDWKIELWG